MADVVFVYGMNYHAKYMQSLELSFQGIHMLALEGTEWLHIDELLWL